MVGSIGISSIGIVGEQVASAKCSCCLLCRPLRWWVCCFDRAERGVFLKRWAGSSGDSR